MDFAQLIGIKQRASIYRYINGRVPKPSVLKKIMNATNGKITAEDFYNTPKSKQNNTPPINTP